MRAVPAAEPREQAPFDHGGDHQHPESFEHDADDLLTELTDGERLAKQPVKKAAVHAREGPACVPPLVSSFVFLTGHVG